MKCPSTPRKASAIALTAVSGILLTALVIPWGAQAHVIVKVGTYIFTVGWEVEPAIIGIKNGLDLGIMDNTTGTPVPVQNAENSLKAKFLYADKSLTLDLVPVFQKPGLYGADIIPTAVGIYKVNLTGKVGTQSVSFNQALDDVIYPGSLEFPNQRPSPENLSTSVNAASGQANDAGTWAKLALGLGAAGVVIGAVALAVAFKYGRRRP